jgi:hypothetical protein
MSLQEFYAWAKKIHKWVMWAVVALGSWMMMSGYLMHKGLGGDFVRFWHNGVSQYFLLVLLAQMITGIVMWGVPKLLSKRV